MSAAYLSQVRAELDAIRAQNRYREVAADRPLYAADFSTNDYLALSTDSRMIEAMRFLKRVGSGGARLLGGGHREHVLLEADLAAWLGRERALLFSSGYLAALGAIAVLAQFVDAIYSDELNHACLIDGIRSTGVARHVYKHRELPARAVRARRALIVTESLFGMDGDLADVAAYAADLGDDDILLVDEAHALGVYGQQGAGLARALEDERIVILGALGKSLGTAGGFIAGPAQLIDLLVNRARTFIFDTAPAPGLSFAARVAVMIAAGADDRRARLFANVDYVREALRSLGLGLAGERSPIVPIVLGSEGAAVTAAQVARSRSVNLPAIRPPTVPSGASRVRASVRSDHSREHLDLLVDTLRCIATS